MKLVIAFALGVTFMVFAGPVKLWFCAPVEIEVQSYTVECDGIEFRVAEMSDGTRHYTPTRNKECPKLNRS